MYRRPNKEVYLNEVLHFFAPNVGEIKCTRRRLSKTHPLYIAGAVCYLINEDFGDIIFQHIGGKHFDIWISHYDIRKPCTIYVTGDVAVIECCFEVTNEKIHYIKPLHPVLCGELTYNLYYFSGIKANVPFKGDKPITTLDIHCPPTLLKKLHKNFPAKIAPILKAIQSSKNQVRKVRKSARIISAQVFKEQQPCLPAIKENLTALMTLLHEKGAKADIRDFVYTLLHLCLAQEEYPVSSPPKEKIADIAAICSIMRHYFPKRYNAEELAQKAYMTRRSFYRAFKTQLGTTPQKFYQKLAMETAFNLIKTTSLGITEIALETGFSSKTSFSRAFQKQFGMPPSQIRKKWHTE